jgi:hypothetical protein
LVQLVQTALAKQLWPQEQSPLPLQSPLLGEHLAAPDDPELELPDPPLEEPPMLPVLQADTCVPLLHFGSSDEALHELTSVPVHVAL